MDQHDHKLGRRVGCHECLQEFHLLTKEVEARTVRAFTAALLAEMDPVGSAVANLTNGQQS